MSESKPKTAQDVYEVVRQLSPDERKLLEILMDNDDNSGWASPELEQAWIEECDRRIQLINEGKAGWVDGEQFMQKLRKSLAE
jgi:hypothetical protein